MINAKLARGVRLEEQRGNGGASAQADARGARNLRAKAAPVRGEACSLTCGTAQVFQKPEASAIICIAFHIQVRTHGRKNFGKVGQLVEGRHSDATTYRNENRFVPEDMVGILDTVACGRPASARQ